MRLKNPIFLLMLTAIVLIYCAFVLSNPPLANAQQQGPYIFAGPVITANGTFDVPSHGKAVTLGLDYVGAGTGTITFTGCRFGRGQSYLPLSTAPTQCTGDCVRDIATVCESYQLTMAACSSCNVKVFVAEEKY